MTAEDLPLPIPCVTSPKKRSQTRGHRVKEATSSIRLGWKLEKSKQIDVKYKRRSQNRNPKTEIQSDEFWDSDCLRLLKRPDFNKGFNPQNPRHCLPRIYAFANVDSDRKILSQIQICQYATMAREDSKIGRLYYM